MKATIATVTMLLVLALGLTTPNAGATTVLDRGDATAGQGQASTSSTLFPKWRRWPGPVIRYHNRYRGIENLVREATKAWNSSGAKVRWRPVPLKRAQVVIKRVTMKKLAGWAGPDRSSTPDGSIPPIGSIHGSVIKISPSVLELSRTTNREFPQFVSQEQVSAKQVLAHEMGHMLGLAHQAKKCSVMNVPMFVLCPDPPEPWQIRCSLLARDDVRGAIRLFGGVFTPPKLNFCRVELPPDPVTEFSVKYVPEDPIFGGKPSIHPQWRMPAKNLPGKAALRWGPAGGECPSSASSGSGRPPLGLGRTAPGEIHSYASNATFAPGTYCFSLFTFSRRGTPTPGYATTQVTFGPSN